MWLFYLCALIPIIIGFVIFLCDKRIIWQEWLIGSITAMFLAVVFHLTAFIGMTDDIETWSGQIANVSYHPAWVEEYEEAHTRTYTTGSGDNKVTHTETYYTTEHDRHPEHWECFATYGTDTEIREIDQQYYEYLKQKFGNRIVDGGKQDMHHGGHFDGGDNNIYLTHNETKYIEPVTIIKHFENRIKAAPTTFSFMKVPTNTPVYEWPENPTWNKSDRLLGEYRIDSLKFDQMNSRLGPSKRVNVIMINFGNKDSSVAHLQEAKWVGGKKNDLVLCYGSTTNSVTWSYVFGWTESELCKRNLQTILLTIPMNDDILVPIENEIRHGYVIKDWTKFDYISIEPPTWCYILYFGLMMALQIGCWVYFHMNDYERTDGKRSVNMYRY